MPNADCPHVPSCEMYSLFRDSGTLETWKMGYCRAKFDRCERFQRSAAGHPVPINLLPSGALLRHKAFGTSSGSTPPKASE